MIQLLLKLVECLLGIVVVAFKLSCLYQFGQLLFAYRVVGKATLYHAIFKIGPISIADVKLGCCSYCGVFRYVFHHIVEHHLGRILTAGRQIEGDVWYGVALKLYIRHNAAAITYLTTITSVEHLSKRVGYMLLITTTALIVVGLNATTAWYVVFRGCYFHVGVVG